VIWLTIQLTAWAEKHQKTQDLIKEIWSLIKTQDLDVFYPVLEDAAGKHLTPYAEYIFLEYTEAVDYSPIEGTDFFRCILKDRYNKYQLLPNTEIEKVRSTLKESSKLVEGDQVRVVAGSLRGNVGIVISVSEENSQAFLEIPLGDEIVNTVIPILWIRKRSKSKRIDLNERQKSLELKLPEISISNNSSNQEEKPYKLKLLRRGKKNSRVNFQGEDKLMPNSKIAKLVASGEVVLISTIKNDKI
jgi:ribosomal protein L24